MNIYDVIKKPLVTEKGTILKEENKYVFAVSKNATKNDIKNAIKKLFNVTVEDVNTVNMYGKTKIDRRTGKFGRKSDWKKAYVKIKKGQKIEALEA